MKKLLFLILIGITYYIAGMYRSQTLLILFAVEVVFAVVMFLLPRIFQRKLHLDFAVKSDVAQKDAAHLCHIQATYRGMLPVSRFRIKLQVSYDTRPDTGKGGKRSSSFRKTQTLYGNCRHGDTRLSFSFCAPFCGLYSVRMDKLRIYDYLLIFSKGKRLHEKMTVAVLPNPVPLSLSLPFASLAKGEQADMQTVDRKGNLSGEVRQLREYTAGDTARSIHWNYSARADELYVKEFEKDADLMTEILLDMSGFFLQDAASVSRFYEILYSFMLTVVGREQTVCVQWFDEKIKTVVSEKAFEKKQCGEILLKLYRTDFSEENAALCRDMTGKYRAEQAGKDSCFRLDLNLCLWYGDLLLKQF